MPTRTMRPAIVRSISSFFTSLESFFRTAVVRSPQTSSIRSLSVSSVRLPTVVSTSRSTTCFARAWPTVIVSSCLTSRRRFFSACW